jgi:hypothetical protein
MTVYTDDGALQGDEPPDANLLGWVEETYKDLGSSAGALSKRPGKNSMRGSLRYY